MGMKETYHLTCDCCGAECPVASTDDEEAQACAEDLGWRWCLSAKGSPDQEAQDMCPPCVAKFNDRIEFRLYREGEESHG